MSHEYFDTPQAAGYDDRFAKLKPTKDALHLALPAVLGELSDRARLLIVGGGTGDELLALAEVRPQWRFTLVEPARAMLDVCQRKAAHLGDRVRYHHGYLDSLPPTEPYDAATAVLVSHFIRDRYVRLAFYRGIHDRLRAGGVLVSVDLCSQDYDALLPIWIELLRQGGIPEEGLRRQHDAFRDRIALEDTEGLLELAREVGFERCVAFYQVLLMRGWSATRPRCGAPPVDSP